jgi:gliding motility-associated-like protein
VLEVPGPDSIMLNLKNAVCGAPYGSAQVTGVTGGIAPFVYSLDAQNPQSGGDFPNLLPGSHTLAALDNFVCGLTSSFSVIATHETPVLIYPKDTVLCYGQSASFTAEAADGSAFTALNWDQNQGNSLTYGKPFYQTAEIVVSATNASGCVTMDTAFVKVNNCDSAGDYCLRFPNAFTPNADGNNDTSGPVAHCVIDKYRLQVFNRYGVKVFYTEQVSQRWDGSFRGNKQETGAYVSTCTYTIGAVQKEEKGIVMLIR